MRGEGELRVRSATQIGCHPKKIPQFRRLATSGCGIVFSVPSSKRGARDQGNASGAVVVVMPTEAAVTGVKGQP